jgi:hypothetical protein
VSQLLTVSGTDLRYLLTAYLFDHGPATVEELVDALAYHGFRPIGRPSKAVSDALRWETARAHARSGSAAGTTALERCRGRPDTGSLRGCGHCTTKSLRCRADVVRA